MSFLINVLDVYGTPVQMCIKPGFRPGKFNSFDKGGIFKWTCLEHMLRNQKVLTDVMMAIDSEVRVCIAHSIVESREEDYRHADRQADVFDGNIVIGYSFMNGKKTKAFRIVFDVMIFATNARVEITDIVPIDDVQEIVLQGEGFSAA